MCPPCAAIVNKMNVNRVQVCHSDEKAQLSDLFTFSQGRVGTSYHNGDASSVYVINSCIPSGSTFYVLSMEIQG
jgi:hypothetical protein